MRDNEFQKFTKEKYKLIKKNSASTVQYKAVLAKKKKKKAKKCSMNLRCIINASTISKIKKIKSPIRFYSPLFQVLILGFVAVLHYNSWGKWWHSERLWCRYVKMLPRYYRPTPTFTPAWPMFGSHYHERMKDIFKNILSLVGAKI